MFDRSQKYRLTACAAAALVLLASQAQAQTAAAAAPKPEAKALETVVVTGIRAARESSLNAKRNADGLVEVVSAEDVGKMPDKNVADSLQRLPGVNTITAGGNEGGFGENDRISLRGTPPSLTSTLMNGHGVGTGDWFILNQQAGGRSVSYTLLPSELIDRVEVVKTSRADLVEGGVAGSVNIKTRKPLNAKTQLSGLVSAGVVKSTLSGKTDPQLSGMVNWKSDDKTLGVMAQVFSEERSLRRDGQEFFWWGSVDTLWGTNAAVLAARPELKGAQMSFMTGATLFEQKRKREGGLVSVQFRPSKDVDLELSGFSSKLKADNYNRNFITVLHKGFVNDALIPTSVSVSNGTVTAMELPGCATGKTCSQVAAMDVISRPGALSSSKFLNLDGEFRISDTLSVSTKIGSTSGKGETPRDTFMEYWAPIDANAKVSYRNNGATSPLSVSVGNSGKFIVGPNPDRNGALEFTTEGKETHTSDKENYAQADATLRMDAGVLERLKFGARYARHTRSNERILHVPKAGGNAAAALAGSTSFYPGDYAAGLGSNPGAIATPTVGQVNTWAQQFTQVAGHDPANEYRIVEPTSAAYVMAELGSDKLTGNIGLRYVKTSTRTERTRSVAGKNELFGVDNNGNEILPSASLRYDLGDGVLLRSSLARTMSRPDFGQLGSLSLDNLTHTGTGGNALLKPIISNNFDVGAEWYFAPRSVVSLALYNMSLSSYVSLGKYKATYIDTATGQPAEYTLTAATNAPARVRGLEVALDMPVGDGFGFNTNYTFASGKELSDACRADVAKGRTHACDMLGTSRKSYNLGGYYEANGLSVRVAYNYRSAFLNGLSRASAIYQDATGTWSASVGYELTKNLTLSFDAKDINKPILNTFVYDANNNKQPNSFYDNGAQYYLTLRAKF